MTTANAPDISAGRLPAAEYVARFADESPPLTKAQALLEAERCLYCHDAPCATACPTGIDVPSFIRRIADGNLRGAARTILESNPLGGMCARVCPTELLCEDVCVRHTQQGQPVQIGRLQRHAVDALLLNPKAPPLFSRAARTGKRVAVVGAGPAGLACAHALARRGHDVVVLDARPKAGGLNEYGLAAYKTTGGFAQREIEWLLSIGGIAIRNGERLKDAAGLDALLAAHDAVFLGVGLGATQRLGVPGEDFAGVRDAVDFIAELRQSADLSTLPVGRRVVVIGGGMTAVDAAVQSRLLGAESVAMVYRRGPQALSASTHEQERAQTQGVTLHHWLAPKAIVGRAAGVSAVIFERQALRDGQLVGTGETETLPADMVLKAIGQKLDAVALGALGLALDGRKLRTDADGRTSRERVWAGGDCRAGGRDLTVEAVEHGKLAAASIHAHLSA